jgi:hypothetical protein
MNPSEALARIYLESLGLGPVVHEPDGQMTPDFKVGDHIAVEVRRLNQNHETEDGYEGLESVTAALRRYMEKLLPTFGPAPEGRGWFVSYDYRRPFDGKAVRAAVKLALTAFKAAPDPAGFERRLTRTFTLAIDPAGSPLKHFYVLGGMMDLDQGGFVVAELIRNLNICIAEKAAKIAANRHRYPQWWLVLPDYVGADAADRASIGEHVDLGPFARVVLIHPRSPTRTLVLDARRAQGAGPHFAR